MSVSTIDYLARRRVKRSEGTTARTRRPATVSGDVTSTSVITGRSTEPPEPLWGEDRPPPQGAVSGTIEVSREHLSAAAEINGPYQAVVAWTPTASARVVFRPRAQARHVGRRFSPPVPEYMAHIWPAVMNAAATMSAHAVDPRRRRLRAPAAELKQGSRRGRRGRRSHVKPGRPWTLWNENCPDPVAHQSLADLAISGYDARRLASRPRPSSSTLAG